MPLTAIRSKRVSLWVADNSPRTSSFAAQKPINARVGAELPLLTRTDSLAAAPWWTLRSPFPFPPHCFATRFADVVLVCYFCLPMENETLPRTAAAIRFVTILLLVISVAHAQSKVDAGWPSYGNDPGGSRYSPLRLINRDNVTQLRVLWTYRTGALPHDHL